MVSFSSFRPVKREEVLHSSAFAQAAAGSHVGTSDGTTFAQRVEREKSRTIIGGYDQAGIRHSYRAESKNAGPNPLARPVQTIGKVDIVRPSRQSFNANRGAVAVPSRPFREPPTRGFNPYA